MSAAAGGGAGVPAPQAPAGGGPGREQRVGLVLVLGSVSSIQFGAALATTLFDRVGAGGAVLVRLLAAAIVLAVLTRPAVRRLHPDARRLVLAYGLALGLMNVFFYLGLARVPLGAAVAIELLGPLVLAAVLSRRAAEGLWVALAVGGVLLIARPGADGAVDPLGALYLLLAAACWAGYILLAQRSAARLPGLQAVALASAVAVLPALVPGLVQGGAELLAPGVLLVGAAVGVVSSVVPYSLESLALRRLPARAFGTLMALEPAAGALAGFLVAGQRLAPVTLAGVALVVVAAAGVAASVGGPPVAPSERTSAPP